jgi:hypothetical protein
VTAALIHADRRTDGHDNAHRCFQLATRTHLNMKQSTAALESRSESQFVCGKSQFQISDRTSATLTGNFTMSSVRPGIRRDNTSKYTITTYFPMPFQFTAHYCRPSNERTNRGSGCSGNADCPELPNYVYIQPKNSPKQ